MNDRRSLARRLTSQDRGLCRRITRFEGLEDRRVLAFLVPITDVPREPDAWAAEVTQGLDFQFRPPQAEVQLRSFDSEDAANASLAELAVDHWQGLLGQELDLDLWEQFAQTPFLGVGTRWLEDGSRLMAVTAAEAPPAPVVSEVPVSLPLLENLRALGIQRADAVHMTNDGFLVAAHESQVLIFDVSQPEEIVRVVSIDIDRWQPQLYATDSRLVSISGNDVRVYDISDRAAPQLLKQLDVQGFVTDSRLNDDQLVLVTNDWVHLPPPQFFVAEGVGPEPVVLGETSLGRFETAEEYVTRVEASLLSHFLPELVETDSAGEQTVYEDVGDWQDFVIGESGLPRHQTNVWMIDLAASDPRVVDSETLQGVSSRFMDISDESVFLVQPRANLARMDMEPTPWLPIESSIYRLSIDGGQELVTDAYVVLPGQIRDDSMLDEYDGYLRVVTDELDAEDFSTHSVNLTILSENDSGGYDVVGEMVDIADGQAVFAAYFSGPQAVITTAEMEGFVPIFDPLHGIDLSDPTNPVELSELEIPGVATQLHWVGNSHLVGVGFIEQEDGIWRDQVSLYDVSDLANPQLVTNWVGNDEAAPNFWAVNQPSAIHFDADTGTLIVPTTGWRRFGRTAAGTRVFNVQTDAESSLEEIGVLGNGEQVRRAFVRGTEIYAVTPTYLHVSTVENPSEILRSIPLSSPLRSDFFVANRGESTVLDVLQNDVVDQDARITAVTNHLSENIVEIAEDGRSLIYTAAATGETQDHVVVVVTSADGSQWESEATVRILREQRQDYSELGAEISILLTDAEGDAIDDVVIGDQVWVELQVTGEGGFSDKGVFQAILNVEFDPEVLEVIGDAEPIAPFTEGIQSTRSETGFAELGGFSSAITPLGPGPQRIARFLVEVKQPGDLRITATPSQRPGNEVLLYGEDLPVDPAKVTKGEVRLRVADQVIEPESEPTDVNADGVTSAMDALLVVNFLNQETRAARTLGAADGEAPSAAHALDVNDDGVVSPLDVLTIVNALNLQVSETPEGEPSVDSQPHMADSCVPAELDASEAMEDDETLQLLASAHVSVWDVERRR